MTATPQVRPVDEQLAYLRKGAAEIIREEELKAKLEKSFRTGTPLRVYLGVDPTAPDIHLGHTVVLRKLKHFQDLGHTAIFLIGDFSAMIGDPTGQSDTRPPLTREQVEANAKTYLAQVFKILDPEKTEVRYNSKWLDKLTSQEIVRLCAKYPLARMLEREDFRSRLESGKLWEEQRRHFQSPSASSQPSAQPSFKFPSAGKVPPVGKPQSIAIHELLYPLLTALDAVELKSDVELGATEQKFNLLVHRDIQREYGLEGEVAFTMPILVGLDGQRKMSKSLGNYVGITEAPADMFGKLMSLSDDTMWSYFDLVTDRTPDEIAVLAGKVKSGALHPMDVKMSLAKEIIAGFHGEAAAEKAAGEFQRVFRDRDSPTDVPVFRVTSDTYKLLALLTQAGLVSSRSEAERLIRGKAVEIDGQTVDAMNKTLILHRGESVLLRAGKKKFLRIVVE